MWFLRHLDRIELERTAVAELAANTDWMEGGRWQFVDGLCLAYDVAIVIDEARFPITLRYPDAFPSLPPYVLPRGTDERWSEHQYGPMGELCLEIRPDNWHPTMTGAMVLQSAHKLLSSEHTPAGAARREIPSDHRRTTGQVLRGSYERFLVSLPLAVLIGGMEAGMTFRIDVRTLRIRSAMTAVVAGATLPDGSTWTDPTVPADALMTSAIRWTGAGVVVPAGIEPPTGDAPAWCDWLAARGVHLDAYPEGKPEFVLVVCGGVPHLVWLFMDPPAPTRMLLPSANGESRLDAAYAALTERQVGIVGCGSVGSKIAVALARTGVQRFVLIDDDVLLPENLVRNDLDWREVGTHKSDGLARRLMLVHPGVVCDSYRARLSGQEPSGYVDAVLSALSKCDLIIDATAEPNVFNLLAGLSQSARRPLLWVEVYGGGIGGLVARSRPGRDPNGQTMRLWLLEQCADWDVPLPTPSRDYAVGGDGPPLVADDADVSVIAAHAARMAIDLLLGQGVSDFPCSLYLIGLRKAWVFEGPFDTIPLDVGSPPPEPEATALTPDGERGRAFIIDLLQAETNASPPQL